LARPTLQWPVSDSERSGTAAMMEALHVQRNATAGFGLATLVTLAVVALTVLPGTSRPAYLYVGLAFVLLVSLGGLLTVVFTAGSAVRLARR